MTDYDYITYFEIKDRCRNELIHYLHKALSVIPKINNPSMLDIGCGTGIPTIALRNYFAGHVLAIDLDTNVLNYLKKKIKTQNLSEKVEVINSSLFDIAYKNESYDIILAEGVLNVVGFKKGLSALLKLANKDTFLVMHDENRDLPEKYKLFTLAWWLWLPCMRFVTP
jgi:ubiquinone/menaquinone biosynthesis C-methylase UbiE